VCGEKRSDVLLLLNPPTPYNYGLEKEGFNKLLGEMIYSNPSTETYAKKMKTLEQGEENRQARKRAVTIIIQNGKGEILLMLRDNKPDIPFPNQWCILGGGIEKDETPEDAIKREMMEEIELALVDPQLFKAYEWEDKDEHAYHVTLDLDLDVTPVHEGQKIQFFSQAEIEKMQLAFHDSEIARDFFESTSNQ